jgi:hypothetical protein
VCEAGETCSSCPQDCAGTDPTDKDCDGIPDALESALAQAWFPNLVLSVDSGAHYDKDRQWFHGSGYISDAYVPYRVRPYKSGSAGPGQCSSDFACLEIQFGLPYEFDAGNCGIGEHPGDAEFVKVLVARENWDGTNSTPWSTAQTSASYWGFYGWGYDQHGSTYHTLGWGRDFGWDGQPNRKGIGASSIYFYASNQKHATYPDLGACLTSCPGGLVGCCESCYFPGMGGVSVRSAALTRLRNAGEGNGRVVESQALRMPNVQAISSFLECSTWPSDPPVVPSPKGIYNVWSGLVSFDGFGGACEASEVWSNKFNSNSDWLTLLNNCRAATSNCGDDLDWTGGTGGGGGCVGCPKPL